MPAGEDTVSLSGTLNYFKLNLRKEQGTIELLVNIFHLILKSMLNFFILFYLGDLMERSFALRRQEMLSNSSSIETVFNRFPFLQELTYVSYKKDINGVIKCLVP